MLSDSSSSDSSSPIRRNGRGKQKLLESPSSDSEINSPIKKRKAPHRRRDLSTSESSSSDVGGRSRKKIKVASSTSDSSFDDDEVIAKGMISRKNMRVPTDSGDSSSDSEIEEICRIRTRAGRSASARASSNESSTSTDDEPSNSISKKSQKALGDSSSDGDDAERCIICFKTYNGEVAQPSGCAHTFHAECLLTWSKTSNTCPIDRVKYETVLVKKASGEVSQRYNVVTPPPQDHNNDIIEPDDTTFCEVCNQQDREEEMLLCDRCEAGYHLNCLTPPLQAIPVGDWYCPDCALIENAVIEEDEIRDLLRGAAILQNRLRRLSESRPPRHGFRTRATNRVIEALQQMTEQPSTSSGRTRIGSGRIHPPRRRAPPRARNTRSRYRVELVTVEDGPTVEVKVAVNTRRRRKKRKSKKSSRKSKTKTNRSSRMGVMAGETSRPSTSGVGSQSLDILGSRPQLEYFSGCEGEDEMDEDLSGGGLGVMRYRRAAATARSMTGRKQIAAQIFNAAPRRPVATAAATRPPASAPPDLLSSILQQQIMWHSPNAVFHSNSNGEVQVVLQGGDPENLPVRKTVGSGESRGGGQRRSGGGGGRGRGEDEGSHHQGGGEPIGPIPPLQPPPQPPVFSRVYDEEDFDLYADIEPPPLMEPPLVPPPEPPALLLAPLEGEEGVSSPEDTMLVIDDRQVYDPDMPTSPPSDVDPSEESEPPLPPMMQTENKPNDYSQAVDLTSIRLPSPEPEMDDCPNRSLYSQASVNIARQTKADSDSDSEPQSELAPIPIPPPLLSSCLNTLSSSLDDKGDSTKIDLFEDASSPDVSVISDSGEVVKLSKTLEEGTIKCDVDHVTNDEKVDIKRGISSNENTEDEEIEVDDNLSDQPKDVKVKCDIGDDKEAMSDDEVNNLCIRDDKESETVKEKSSSEIIAESNGVCGKEADYELMDTSDPLEKTKSIKENSGDEGSCSSQQEVDEQLQKNMEDIKLGSGDDEKKQVETKYEEDEDEEDNLKLNYSDVSSSIKKSDSSLDIPKSDQHSDAEEQAVKCEPSTSRNNSKAEEHIEKKVLRKSRSSSKKTKKRRGDSSGEGSPRRNNVDSEKSDRDGEDVLELGCGDDERDGLVDITDEEMSNYEKCWEIEEHQGDKAGIEGLETEAISDCEYNIAEEVIQTQPKFTAENGPKEEGEIVSEERRPVSPIQWKKISKSTKERSYRDKDSYKEKSKKKEKKPKEKRKELERYDVRKIISDKPKKRKVDEFGRDISSSKSRSRSGSRSRSLSRRKSRSRSRKRRSQEKRSRNKSRGKSRERDREKKSKERQTTVKIRDRSKRSRGRSSKSRSRSGSRRKRSRSPRRNDRKERRSRPKSKERGEKKKRARRESSFSCSSCSCSSCERERRKTNKKLTVIVPNKSAVSSVVKDKRKGKYREKEVSKRRRADSPVPSKEVFTSGDNILVSVNFKSSKTGERSREKEKSKKKKDDEPKKKKDKNAKENQPIRSIVSKGGLSEPTSVKRKKLDLKNVKPVAIIDLAQSPFREQTLSPTEVIVLTDSDSDDKRKNDETNHQPMVTGPKTPPEPQIRFNIVSSKPQIRNLTNPLMDSVEQGERDGEEDDERIEILHKGPNTPPEPPVPYDPFEPTKSRSPSPLIDIESARNPSPSVVEIISRPTEVPQHAVGHRDVSPKLIMQHDSPKTPSPLHSPPKPVRESTPEKAALSPANNHNDDSLDMGGGGGDSPYSPGSSDGDDMFEPSMMPQISTPTPIAKVKPRPIQQPPKHSALKLTPSPLKRKPAKTSTPLKNSKGNSRKEIGLKLDEDQLKILDDLPNSAVEMQVKDKFLKKLNRQERVVEEVKMVLKPHYAKKHVTKEEYKEILRKSVPKICHSRSQEINPMKIQRLIEAYVKKYRHHKKKRKPFLGGLPESLQQVLKPKPKTTMWC